MVSTALDSLIPTLFFLLLISLCSLVSSLLVGGSSAGGSSSVTTSFANSTPHLSAFSGPLSTLTGTQNTQNGLPSTANSTSIILHELPRHHGKVIPYKAKLGTSSMSEYLI